MKHIKIVDKKLYVNGTEYNVPPIKKDKRKIGVFIGLIVIEGNVLEVTKLFFPYEIKRLCFVFFLPTSWLLDDL